MDTLYVSPQLTQRLIKLIYPSGSQNMGRSPNKSANGQKIVAPG